MDKHVDLTLASMCRTCGKLLQEPFNRKKNKIPTYLTLSYKQEICGIFGIDVNLDVMDLHPPIMCAACHTLCMTWRRRNGQGCKKRESPRFHPHTDNCSLCLERSVFSAGMFLYVRLYQIQINEIVYCVCFCLEFLIYANVK